jgi:hypothetical protein
MLEAHTGRGDHPVHRRRGSVLASLVGGLAAERDADEKEPRTSKKRVKFEAICTARAALVIGAHLGATTDIARYQPRNNSY